MTGSVSNDTCATPNLVVASPRRPTANSVGVRAKRLWHTCRSGALGIVSLALFLLLWHLATTYRLDLYVRFSNIPTPFQVFERAETAFSSHRFISHILISIRRIILGFGIAAIVGVPLGLAMGRFRLVRELAFPVCEVLRPIPAIAWVPMSVMLWPTSESSIVFITFLGSFFPILINTIHGMASLDKILIRAAASLGAKETAMFWEVYLPGSLPQIFTGLTVGMGIAWVSLIAAEMISGQFGIGYFTWESYSQIEYADIVLGMICIGVLGLISSGIIRAIGSACTPWVRNASSQGGK